MTKTYLLVVFPLLFTGTIAGCQNESDDTVVGVDKSKRLSGLTLAEQLVLCEHYWEKHLEKTNIEEHCHALGIMTIVWGGSEEDCEQKIESCPNDPSELHYFDPESLCFSDQVMNGGIFSHYLKNSCDITLKEYDRCRIEEIAVYEGDPFNALTCVASDWEIAAIIQQDAERDLPPSCEKIAEQCPERYYE